MTNHKLFEPLKISNFRLSFCINILQLLFFEI